MSAPVTIHMLAQRLGVSPMTVSYALRGKGRIGRQTREKILQTAQELGYRPNASARATRTGRFGCIGLVISADQNFSYTPYPLMWGIESAAEQVSSHLTLARMPVDASGQQQAALPKFLREGLVDGLLMNYTHAIPDGLQQTLAASRTPTVWINCKLPNDCVYPDDRGGARLLTEQYLGLGHKRIAFAIYERGSKDAAQDHYSVSERYAGYCEAMQQAGLQPRLIQHTQTLPKSEWLDYTRQWMRHEDRPTAVIAYRTSTARPIRMAAVEAGLRSEVAVATFSEWEAEDESIGIKSILIPFYEVGVAAVQMLRRKILNPTVMQAALAVPYATPGTDSGVV
ncbi:MAG TPA: LacI family DNA-binding transcriptional regulator [Planctomycetota bacterium]|nr:LacI family DNA-binding transcriptional regulator [Planctomycetota bacterium]